MARTLVAGNWKMNGTSASLPEIEAIAAGVTPEKEGVEALICVPATLLTRAAAAAKGTALMIGAETCHARGSGAHTGDISAPMIADTGASHVIVGHSERRADHGESSEIVAAQAAAALEAGLTPIICIGETAAERDSGKAIEVVTTMLSASLPAGADPSLLVIAYEPVWAIGTGNVATVEAVDEMHTALRARLTDTYGAAAAGIPILYGGSMNPGNAAGLLAVRDVNGGLIGGASLKAADFLAIYAAA
ncbi:MAG: triose-phosphate isomerase [Hyphomonas sp.]|uniref:triose-phosphate isomerase n=1 Tax=Hyphomonas sp. TaxID=87 RepID=UPI003528A880